jgi:outer membrane protein OmpA-like peptidoglycan-associated protein
MKIRFILSLAALMLAMPILGQKKNKDKEDKSKEEQPSGPVALVADASFEVSEDLKNLKSYEMLTSFLKNWGTPNVKSADLFNAKVKTPKVGVPKNDFGTEPALDGDGYAGFRAYTKDAKKSRTYLQTKLTSKLKKDAHYCVKFNLSLADLSKFGVNNVGIFFSDRKIQNANDGALTFKPQITEKSNKAIVTLEGWETICGSYIGTGKEEYIIIGCFGEEKDLKVEKVKKPAGQTGVVLADAYYYIDMIEIVEVEAPSQCFCGPKEDQEPDLIYSRTVTITPDMKANQIIAATMVWFSFLGAEVTQMFDEDLSRVAELMKANPSMKIELIGHSETDEVGEAKVTKVYDQIALKRANAVKDYLVAKGVDASRITTGSKDNTAPATSKTTPLGKAQNRRVEFVVK